MRSIAALLLAAGACSNAESAVDASPLVDASADADTRCPLAVNEVAAAGDPDDWFELVNVSAAPVDLAGFRFIDELDDPTLAVVLPGTVLAPGGRLVEEVTDPDDGFQLGADDALWLYRVGEDTPCDGVDWAAGASPAGGSYSRVPDGTGPFRTTTPATRGAPN